MSGKMCSKCKEFKGYDEFTPDRRARGGLRPECHSCQAERGMTYYHKNREVIRAKAKAKYWEAVAQREADYEKNKAHLIAIGQWKGTKAQQNRREKIEARKAQKAARLDALQGPLFLEWLDRNPGFEGTSKPLLRRCTSCKEVKVLAEAFQLRDQERGYRQSMCRACFKEYGKRRRKGVKDGGGQSISNGGVGGRGDNGDEGGVRGAGETAAGEGGRGEGALGEDGGAALQG